MIPTIVETMNIQYKCYGDNILEIMKSEIELWKSKWNRIKNEDNNILLYIIMCIYNNTIIYF